MLLSACNEQIVAKCPQLANPPPVVLRAMETVRNDPDGRAWVVALSKHLDKLKVCR